MEANWKPIEMRLGRSRCVGFMYMGRINGVNLYKHGITRGYLNLDDDGNCYTPSGGGCYSKADFALELLRLEAELKRLHATLETPYDDVFLAGKTEELRQRGISLVTIRVETEDLTIH
jgi:hypothetical protein